MSNLHETVVSNNNNNTTTTTTNNNSHIDVGEKSTPTPSLTPISKSSTTFTTTADVATTITTTSTTTMPTIPTTTTTTKTIPTIPTTTTTTTTTTTKELPDIADLFENSVRLRRNLLPTDVHYSTPAERRAKRLAKQKQKRRDAFDVARRIAMGECGSSESESEGEKEETPSLKRTHDDQTGGEVLPPEMGKYRCLSYEDDYKYKPKKRAYRNKIMYSECFENAPENFAKEWVLKICPVGKRCLLVSSKGQTKAYQKNGYLFSTFSSGLPGGSHLDKNYKNSNYCIIDCIFDEIKQTFFVLDLMCWKGQPFYDTPASLRFFWLNSKIGEELPLLQKKSKYNTYLFSLIEDYECSDLTINSVVKANTNNRECDGVLFYHLECHYKHGVSPLVLWIKRKDLLQYFPIQSNAMET